MNLAWEDAENNDREPGIPERQLLLARLTDLGESGARRSYLWLNDGIFDLFERVYRGIRHCSAAKPRGQAPEGTIAPEGWNLI